MKAIIKKLSNSLLIAGYREQLGFPCKHSMESYSHEELLLMSIQNYPVTDVRIECELDRRAATTECA